MKYQAHLNAVAKALEGLIRREVPGGVIDAVDAVSLECPLGDNLAYAAIYVQEWDGATLAIRGVSGYRIGKACYTFDRIGIEDSWYPYDWDKAGREKLLTVAETVRRMNAELERAKKALAERIERERVGTVVNFGPTSRTWTPHEIDYHKKLLAKGQSFMVTPGGMGTAFRFYQTRTRKRDSRYGHGVPASMEARKLLDAPNLVYDTVDYD